MTRPPADEPWTPEEIAATEEPGRPLSVWRIAVGVALGVIAAAIIVIPAATLWDQLMLRPNIDDLPREVKASMQSSLRSDEAYKQYSLTVETLTLIKTGENTYTGMATVRPMSRSANEVAVTVYYDGDRMIWNTEPGAFLWLHD